MGYLINLSSITEETLPLVLATLSILITGNIIRLIYFVDNFKDIIQTSIKFRDTISISAGLIINWITLYFLGSSYSLQGFKVYSLPKTWLWIVITTIICGLIVWQYKLYGKKWIKDILSDVISLIIGLFFMIAGIGLISKWISFKEWDICQTISCNIAVVVEKIFFLLIIVFLIYAGFKLISVKKRRYPKPKTR